MKKFSRQIDLAHRVSLVGIVVNLILCIGKLTAGVIAHSAAMVSDAVHSASDILSTFIALVGLRLAGREADAEHPYGHDRFECVASILLSDLLFVTGCAIGWSGIQNLRSAQSLQSPGVLALVAAVVSIVVKEWMYRYTMGAAKKLDSVALKASAWDHRSDALSSVGSFLGILGARLGFPILDPIASIVICLFILNVAVDIFREAIGKSVDRACSQEIQDQLRQTASSQPGVHGIDLLLTRQFGSGIYVDMEISVDGNLSVFQAHDIAELVHDQVEAAQPAVRHCMVHVNPAATTEP